MTSSFEYRLNETAADSGIGEAVARDGVHFAGLSHACGWLPLKHTLGPVSRWGRRRGLPDGSRI